MKTNATRWLLLGGVALAVAWLAFAGRPDGDVHAQEAKAKASDRQADREAIGAMKAKFAAAFQAHDAAGAAAFMTAEAEMIPDEGDPVKGRAAIQKAFANQFAKTCKPKVSMKVESLRFPSRDTALEDGEMTATREGESPETHRYHILYVREDGQWLISIIKEWPEETTGLDDLGWLIGTWTAKAGDAEVNNTYEWFGSKAFIKASISVRGKDRSFTAMQIIGLDPVTGDLRTWTFEQNGGLGEGTVRRDGHHWVFENAATLTGGAVLETTNILVPVDANTITWQPVNLAIDGELVGNLPPTKLTRVKK